MMYRAEFGAAEFHRSAPVLHLRKCAALVSAYEQRHTAPFLWTSVSEAGLGLRSYADVLLENYEGRTDCRNPASLAVALYCGMGSSSLNALVKAFERLHMVRGWNSSCTG